MTYAFKVLFKEVYHLLKSKQGREFLKLCLKIGEKPRYTTQVVKFKGVDIKIVDAMSFIWQAYDIYFREVYAFDCSTVKPYIIDCGSNVGLSIQYFKECYPGAIIEGFEPDPEVYTALLENVGHMPNVRVNQVALWTHENGISFNQENADSGYIDDEGNDTIRIPSKSLKRILESSNEVDLLKMDVEGAEFELMRDCADSLDHVKRIFIEVHTFSNQEQRLSSILKILEDAGFRYFIENANNQVMPLKGNWRTTETDMDLQLNIYGIKGNIS